MKKSSGQATEYLLRLAGQATESLLRPSGQATESWLRLAGQVTEYQAVCHSDLLFLRNDSCVWWLLLLLL